MSTKLIIILRLILISIAG